jgi:hypothetical protein
MVKAYWAAVGGRQSGSADRQIVVDDELPRPKRILVHSLVGPNKNSDSNVK